jgi:hypothetical protein
MFFGTTLIGNNDAVLKGILTVFFIYDSSATLRNKIKKWLNQKSCDRIYFYNPVN